MAVESVNFLVKVNTGTEAVPVWTAAGSQKDAKLNRDMSTIDVTNKGSSGWEEVLPNVRSWGIDCNSLYIPDDVAYEALEDAWEARDSVEVQFVENNGDTFKGSAYITSFPKSAPNGDAVSIDVTFKGTGELTRTEV